MEPGLLSDSLFLFFSPSPPLCPERNLEKHSKQQRQENQRPDGLAAARLGPRAQAVRRRRERIEEEEKKKEKQRRRVRAGPRSRMQTQDSGQAPRAPL